MLGGGGGGGCEEGGGWLEKSLHSDLKISSDEAEREKFEGIGSGDDPPSSVGVVGGTRRRSGAERRWSRSGAADGAARHRETRRSVGLL